MKRALKLSKYVALLLLLIVGVSCSKDNNDFIETQWEVVNVAIKEKDWMWNNEAKRYEVIVDLPEMGDFIYENGVQLGYVFIGQQGVDEVQKLLPYVKTYYEEYEDDELIIYTETISCDFQLGNSSTAAFYIQSSDLFRDDSILSDYNFRIVLIW